MDAFPSGRAPSERPRSGGGCLLAVGFEPRVDQGDARIDDRMAETLLSGDELHQLVGALDVGQAVVERAGSRGRAYEALGGGGIFFEWHEIVGIGAQLDAEIDDEVVDRARRLDIAVDGFLRGP